MVKPGRLDRDLEFIPTDEELADRRVQGKGLTRPELAVLVSYSKAILKEELLESDLGKDPHLANAVATAFPQRLVDIYPDEVREHRLHREIMDHSVDAQVQMEMMVNLIRLVKRTTRWLLRNRRHELTPTRVIAEFSDGVAQLRGALPTLLRGRSRAAQQYKSQYQYYIEQGVDETLAATVAATLQAYTALGIIQAAVETHEPLEWQQRTLAVGVLRHMCEDRDLLKCLSTWQEHEAPLIKRWQEMLTELHATSAPDFAMFAVANRELLDLAQSSRRE